MIASTEATTTPSPEAIATALDSLFESLSDATGAQAQGMFSYKPSKSGGVDVWVTTAENCHRDWFFDNTSFLGELQSAVSGCDDEAGDGQEDDAALTILQAAFATPDEEAFDNATTLYVTDTPSGDGQEYEVVAANIDRGWAVRLTGAMGEYTDEDADVWATIRIVRGTPEALSAYLQSKINDTVTQLIHAANAIAKGVPERFQADALQKMREAVG